MPVLAANRSESKLKFYVSAIALRKSIYFFLLRDFGIKDKIRTVESFSQRMNKTDMDLFQDIMERNHFERLDLEYPEWMIKHFRDPIFNHVDSLIDNITHAYTIWPTMHAEYEERRIHIDRAIGDCEALLKDFEKAADILPIKIDKMMPTVKKISEVIALLKGWRKSDNKRFKNLK